MQSDPVYWRFSANSTKLLCVLQHDGTGSWAWSSPHMGSPFGVVPEFS